MTMEIHFPYFSRIVIHPQKEHDDAHFDASLIETFFIQLLLEEKYL